MTTKPECAQLSGAEMVVQSLIEEGVEQIFGYPGGSVLDIYDALHAIMEHYGPGTLATDELYENAVRALCKAQGKEFDPVG